MRKYIPRIIEKLLLRSSEQFPAVLLTGPRQTGKSTTLTRIFPNHEYISLDSPQLRSLILNDPVSFFEERKSGIILDEIQNAPELLPYIKMGIDKNREFNGKYIITGSQHFPLMKGVSESLAGRVAIHELLGFSICEILPEQNENLELNQVFDMIHKGFYPDVAIHKVDVNSFYSSYVQSYLQKDIRDIMAVHNLSLFQIFLELLASRAGSILNLNEISKECGISFNTAKNWLSLLESTRIVYLLKPYYKNITKRVIKSPKLYFTDTGLLANILRYPSAAILQTSPIAGNIFENFIIMELLKKKLNYNCNYELYFYRDTNGNEADVVVELASKYALIEIKMTKTPTLEHLKPLKNISPLFQNSNSFLLTSSADKMKINQNITIMHWHDFLKLDELD